MGWSAGWDHNWKRDIGYGVPAWCDHPDCDEVINRGLVHVCGNECYGGDDGCGLFFCGKHLSAGSLCERCEVQGDIFIAKPDHPRWLQHKATHPSWAEWRASQQ